MAKKKVKNKTKKAKKAANKDPFKELRLAVYLLDWRMSEFEYLNRISCDAFGTCIESECHEEEDGDLRCNREVMAKCKQFEKERKKLCKEFKQMSQIVYGDKYKCTKCVDHLPLLAAICDRDGPNPECDTDVVKQIPHSAVLLIHEADGILTSGGWTEIPDAAEQMLENMRDKNKGRKMFAYGRRK